MILIIKKTLIFVLLVLALGIFSGCGSDKTPSTDDPSDNTDMIDAYLIKIDGKEIGYISNENEKDALLTLLTEKKHEELKDSSAEVIKITVNNKIESSDTLCHPKDIQSAEDIIKKYEKNGGKISFSVTVSESEIKYISFETVYNNSSSHFEGTKVVKTEGQNGQRTLKYEVTYTDGSEESRKLISDTVTKKPVNKVVLLGTKKSTDSTGKYDWPLSSVTITSSYGNRYLNGKNGFHYGIDLRASTGTSVYAADGGKVIYAAYNNGGYGNLIKIQHDNGDLTYYAHLSKISVSAGSRVFKGQLIGKSGATGNVTGPHLHFEIRKNGSAVNPIGYLPSSKAIAIVYTSPLESCSLQTVAYLSHSGPRASSYSKREQEA